MRNAFVGNATVMEKEKNTVIDDEELILDIAREILANMAMMSA